MARHIRFPYDKPLAATDGEGAARLADAIEQSRLVVGVGYHLRALDILAEVRARLAERPAQLFVARWLDSTASPAWWGRTSEGGGQVVEEATDLYDLARTLVGEATVVGAALSAPPRQRDARGRRRRQHRGGPALRDRRRGVVRQHPGRGARPSSKNPAIVLDRLLTRLSKRPDRGQGDWHVTFDDGR